MEWVVVVVLGFAGVALAVKGVNAWSRRSLIAALPTSRIADGPEGLVELKGRIEAIETLEAPFSGTPCVYYTYRVEEYRSSGRSGRWVTLRDGADGRPFLLDDGSGKALVEMRGAETEIVSEDRARMGTFNGPDERLTAFLGRVGVDPAGFFGFNRAIRVAEKHLIAGHSLYVLGHASRPSGEAQAGERIVVSKRAAEVFFVSDEDEETLLSNLLWRTLACLSGAVIIFGLALAFALLRSRVVR